MDCLPALFFFVFERGVKTVTNEEGLVYNQTVGGGCCLCRVLTGAETLRLRCSYLRSKSVAQTLLVYQGGANSRPRWVCWIWVLLEETEATLHCSFFLIAFTDICGVKVVTDGMSEVSSAECSIDTLQESGSGSLLNAHDVLQRSTVLLSESMKPEDLVSIMDIDVFQKDVVDSLRLLRQLTFYRNEPLPFKAVPGARTPAPRRPPSLLGKAVAYVAFLLAFAWTIATFYFAASRYLFGGLQNFGQVLLGILYSFLTFGAVMWNVYCITAFILRIFIPKGAYQENGDYFSVVPEEKSPEDEWPAVTIQIPVYRENFLEVIQPTLESCLEAQRQYMTSCGGFANIVVCDDGILRMLRNDVELFDVLWRRTIDQANEPVDDDADEVYVSKLLAVTDDSLDEAEAHKHHLHHDDILEVLERLRFYHRYQIGFVARTTNNRRGKFKKAGNLNHSIWTRNEVKNMLKMAPQLTYEEALRRVTRVHPRHPFVAEGNVQFGEFVILNDSDARMSDTIIEKTIPEFLNNAQLAFTQHTTKTLDNQRSQSYFLRMLQVSVDALYQLHFVAGGAMGYHPPLVGHSVFLRTEALEACGRMQEDGHMVYWSEGHISEDFELMMNFYNAGYIGRYVAFPDTEFQEGITRNFDEEAIKLRKFSSGAHELMFNPFNKWVHHGILSDLFHRFFQSAMPFYYKVHLVAYLSSYFSAGLYFIVITTTMILYLFRTEDLFFTTNPIAILIINLFIYTILGAPAAVTVMVRTKNANDGLIFSEYRGQTNLKFAWLQLFYTVIFPVPFYFAIQPHLIAGMADHMFDRTRIFGATNKDDIQITFREAFWDICKNNFEPWIITTFLTIMVFCAYFFGIAPFLTVALPPLVLNIFVYIVPFVFNPQLWGALGSKTIPTEKEQMEKRRSLRDEARQRLGEDLEAPVFPYPLYNASNNFNPESVDDLVSLKKRKSRSFKKQHNLLTDSFPPESEPLTPEPNSPLAEKQTKSATFDLSLNTDNATRPYRPLVASQPYRPPAVFDLLDLFFEPI